MKDFAGPILLTASHLMRFVGCQEAMALDLQHLHGDGPLPHDPGEEAQILRDRGDAHEAAYLARLKVEGRHVVEIPRGPISQAAAATRELLAKGPEIVFQGALQGGLWGGFADFLERVEKPSALGSFSYEVADTKLKRTATPKHVLQLVVYSDLLARIQGIEPEFGHVQLGNGTRASLRLTQFAAYSRRARARLEAFVTQPWPTRPVPCPDCDLCHWSIRCEDAWLEEDSLFNVAGITRSQVAKLEAQGIRTMAELASLDRKITKLPEITQVKITTQARLQLARKAGGEPTYVLRPPEPGRGFDLLPEPRRGDLFYDIEGDPYYEGGLEYLHGLWFDAGFKAFWAHSHEEEKEALGALLAFFEDRLKTYPEAHIYHYAPYEVTVLISTRN